MRREFATTLLLSTLVSFLVPELISVGEAVWLNIPKTGTKCVSEEIQSKVVVLADYLVISDEHSIFPTVSVKVTSPYGSVLHHSENATHGQFAFTTQESGTYLACFEAVGNSHGNNDISINLDWKTGIAAKDWDSIARKEKIEGVELELRKLEAAVEAIHENLLYLRNREAECAALFFKNMSDEEHHFESSDAGASKTYPQQAGNIRKGGYIVIKGRPCKVVEVSTSKTGKHGHAKCHFVAIDIFTSKKLEDIVPSSHNCDVPHVNRVDYQLIDISEDGFVSLLTDNGSTKDDLKLPTDEALLTQLKSGFEEGKDIVVSVMSAMGEEQMCALKEVSPK